MPRKYTTELLNMIEEGLISHEKVVEICLSYMSEDDVKDMMESNELLEETEDEEIDNMFDGLEYHFNGVSEE